MNTWKDYEKLADTKTVYGATFRSGKWEVRLWHPFAKKVEMVIFSKENQDKEVDRIEGTFTSPNWHWDIKDDIDGAFYQYVITQGDGSVTIALDPFAKSLAAFNWEGKDTKVGKAAFVKVTEVKKFKKLESLSSQQPIIYEAHVRDMTSLRKDVALPGTYNALKEAKVAEHLRELGITHVQFLPIHACYTLDENNKKVLNKGDGKGWDTNYNWGYDPHNYFSVNGWLSSDANDPYVRMNEFKDVVDYFHKQDVKVIVDVVYNHLYDNSILENVIPGYYFRENSGTNPVSAPALASEREMTRRIIVDSLVHFVKVYDVDGFRFDLSTFIDKETTDILAKELRKVKPNLVLHGEAWDFTDLPAEQTYNKMHNGNDIEFGYFNDTTRNSIKGEDDEDGFEPGLAGGNLSMAGQYLSSIVGNIRGIDMGVKQMDTDAYHLFATDTTNVLNYAACHDGHTLWDKVNLTAKGTFEDKMETYRQTILLQQLLQGRTLLLEGTEMLYTKPSDESGQDYNRSHSSPISIDVHGLKPESYSDNSYKTTDYVNGLRWEAMDDPKIKEVFKFIQSVNRFRKSSKLFTLITKEQIEKAYKFNYVNEDASVIDFTITESKESLRVIHNLSDADYDVVSSPKGVLVLDSTLDKRNSPKKIVAKSSVAMMVA